MPWTSEHEHRLLRLVNIAFVVDDRLVDGQAEASGIIALDHIQPVLSAS